MMKIRIQSAEHFRSIMRARTTRLNEDNERSMRECGASEESIEATRKNNDEACERAIDEALTMLPGGVTQK